MAKHYIVRPKSAVQIDGEIKTPDDQVAHIITDIDLYTLCSSIVYQKFDCQELADGDEPEFDIPPDVSEGGSLVGDVESNSSSPTDTSPVVQVVESNQDDQLELIAYYMENGLSETIAEALMEATLSEEVQDRELLKTMDGIREWIAKHKDLTELPKIGKTRSEEIQKVLNN